MMRDLLQPSFTPSVATNPAKRSSDTNISNLTTSEPSELARINNVTRKATFPTNSEVIVPVNCYGQGQYYQSNTTYILKPNDTYFTVASNTYQGLSTCDSLMRENPYHQLNLIPNMVLQVPLRCACPTTHQVANGTMYLLTYLVNWDDTIPDIADRFHVSTKNVLEANGFPDENPNLTPSTTILIPLPTEPSSSETITHHQKPVISGSFYNSKNKRKQYIVLAISLLIVLSVILAAVFLFHKKLFRGFWQKGCKDITVLGRQSNASLRRQSTARLRVEIADFGQALKDFEFNDIQKATRNFSNENRIKGSMYRGVFGQKVLAVKNMSREATEEVKMLKKINHFNLINLEDVCEKHGSYYLVFEYMENGSLRE
ncbi:lysm domain receptor-like kinase 4 [Quercus suber]|uniref:Lysm domain receptor-like kinase 4 n=1 Tax=Quercus suber TaxID=58331 RepID=A0AAW0LWG8_QUESU